MRAPSAVLYSAPHLQVMTLTHVIGCYVIFCVKGFIVHFENLLRMILNGKLVLLEIINI